MKKYSFPKFMVTAKDALRALRHLDGQKAFVCVGGNALDEYGYLGNAMNYMNEGGMEIQLFEKIEEKPSLDTVLKGVSAMKEFQPDWIVAMGSDSAITAAKAMWMIYENPLHPNEDLRQKSKGGSVPAKRVHFCAVRSEEDTEMEEVSESDLDSAYADVDADMEIVDPDVTANCGNRNRS